MTSRRRARDARDERGGIIVSSLIFLTLIMLMTSVVIDVGMARIVRADMQSLADTTALDLANTLDGSATAGTLRNRRTTAGATFANAKTRTIARNIGTVGGNTSEADVTIELGMADNSTGKWLRVAGNDEYPNAVRATAAGTPKSTFWPGAPIAFPARTATAMREAKSACITVGSYLAALDTSAGGTQLASFLNRLTPTHATIFSADGLLALRSFGVPLAGLIAELNVGNPSSPLDTNVTLAQLAHASAAVLQRTSGSAASSAVVELNRIASVAQSSGLTQTVKLGDFLQLGAGNSAAVLAGDVNVFDLVTAPVFAFDGSHVVDLPAIGVNVPGFTTNTLRVTVIEPPKTVCGGARSEVTSSQVRLTADLSLTLPKYKKCTALDLLCGVGNLLNSLGSLLGGTWKEDGNTVLNLKVELGGVNATARIRGIASCEPSPNVDVEVTTALTTGKITLSALNGTLTGTTNIPQATSSTATRTFTTSPDSWSHVGGVGTNVIGPVNLATDLHSSPLASAIILNLGAVNLGSQLTNALNTALSGLGLSLNGATVTLSKMGQCNGFGLRE